MSPYWFISRLGSCCNTSGNFVFWDQPQSFLSNVFESHLSVHHRNPVSLKKKKGWVGCLTLTLVHFEFLLSYWEQFWQLTTIESLAYLNLTLRKIKNCAHGHHACTAKFDDKPCWISLQCSFNSCFHAIRREYKTYFYDDWFLSFINTCIILGRGVKKCVINDKT